MRTALLIFVGGFLGAGKTTLVAQATQRLLRRGKRVGLITNDQAANLVDTELLRAAGSPVCEVAGGCFCCRFEDLIAATERLMSQGNPDVLIGEPVGSCTDISATVLQPMKNQYRERFRVAPFSVLVDVKQVRTLERLRASLRRTDAPRFPENVMYIYQKQLEEADVVVLNKADLLPRAELAEIEETLRKEFSHAPLVTMSARSGEGVDAWLDCVLEDRPSGRTVADVDYDDYAAGEAALGWLNAAIQLGAHGEIDWKQFCLELITGLRAEFRSSSAEVAHLKLHLSTGDDALVANLTGNDEIPSLRGDAGQASRQARLLVNARARIDPDRLRAIVERQLQAVSGKMVQLEFENLQSFAPARPEPKHRYGSVVP
jgi:G3E family GTPase